MGQRWALLHLVVPILLNIAPFGKATLRLLEGLVGGRGRRLLQHAHHSGQASLFSVDWGYEKAKVDGLEVSSSAPGAAHCHHHHGDLCGVLEDSPRGRHCSSSRRILPGSSWEGACLRASLVACFAGCCGQIRPRGKGLFPALGFPFVSYPAPAIRRAGPQRQAHLRGPKSQASLGFFLLGQAFGRRWNMILTLP